jgi:ADP-heptose:LPS heptosyltransferase
VEFPLQVPESPAVDAIEARTGGSGFVLINAGAAWPNKRWPPARFGQLARRMRERLGPPSVVLWGPGEESQAAEVVSASGGAAELAPRTAIADLFAISRRARLMVSGDTGPLHIAASVGTPVVALFGPSSPQRNGPWNASDITLTRFDACSCHYERRCRRSEPCIDDITVDQVMAAVETRLAHH